MPGIVALVSAISDDVIARLASANYPALTDGKILLGRQHQYEQSAPPRILFIPTVSNFSGKDVFNSTETSLQRQTRSILTDAITFEIRCWGVSTPADPDTNFDVTQAYYQTIILSIQQLCAGNFSIGRGEWTESKLRNTQLDIYGREFVFSATFGTPILATLLPLASSGFGGFPPGFNPSSSMVIGNGSTGTGCSG